MGATSPTITTNFTPSVYALASLTINSDIETLTKNTSQYELKTGRNEITVDVGSIDVTNFSLLDNEYTLTLPTGQNNIVLNILSDDSGSKKVIIYQS